MAHKRTNRSRDNLKIGDTVLLFYKADRRFAGDSADESGYILADLSGSGSRQLLTVQPSESTHRQLPSIQFGTFKVLASNKYEAQTRYRALFEKLKELRKKKISQSAIQLLQLQASQAKRDSEVEQAENASNQKRLEGTSINYSDSIQLLHTLTGKYVCVSSSETSVTENSKLKVYLQRKDSVGCIFRLHPHIKVQTVGEEVNYDDQIKFESVATEGQFLHCSKRTFGEINININGHCFELNVSAKESPLKIVRHSQATIKGVVHPDRTLRASGIVRFFHRKHQCYIVGEGSFAGRYASLPDISDDDDDDDDPSSGPATTSSLLGSTLRRASLRSTLLKEVNVPTDMEPTDENKPAVHSQGEAQGKVNLLAPSKVPSVVTTDSGRTQRKEIRIQDDDVVSQDVHFRSRRILGGIGSPPSSSPNTFWQIEKYHDPCSGEPMAWSEKCRIKHLPTRRYLAVTGDATNYKVTLKTQKLDANSTLTVFELFPVVQQVSGEISQESYVRVKHIDTDTWLHLNKDLRYIPASDGSFDAEENLDEESGKELYQIIATKEINSDDAFALQKVGDKLVTDFNYVAGVTAVLINQLQQCESLGNDLPHSPEVCYMRPTLSTLHYLKYLLLKERDAMKSKQKLLKGMKTLELVIRLLNLHKDEKSNDQEVCTACFGIIIAFLEGNSSKNKIYISQMIGHIFTASVWETELSDGETVEKALVGIARDNPSLLYDVNFMKQVSSHMVQKLSIADKNSDRAIQLLDGLSVLCACNGAPIKQNQNIILEELQNAYNNGEDQPNKMLYPLRIEGDEGVVESHFKTSDSDQEITEVRDKRGADSRDSTVLVHVKFEEQTSLQLEDEPPVEASHKPKAETSRLLEEEEEEYDGIVQFQALEKKESWHYFEDGTGNFFDFFLAQLHLLVQMCRGNNEAVISVLRGTPGTKTFGVEITFPIIMCAINDTDIKETYSDLRAMLLELLKVMYVEVGKNRPFLEKFPFSFKIDEVSRIPFETTTKDIHSGEASITALTGIENEHFPAIRKWIETFFQDQTQYFFAADENKKNGVVVKVLQLLTVLVKDGYYYQTLHVDNLLRPLYQLLDGRNDFPTKEIKKHVENDLTIEQSWIQRGSTRRHPNSQSLEQGPDKNRRRRMKSKQHSLDQDDPQDVQVLNPENVQKALADFREKGGRYSYTESHHYHFEIKHWAMEVLDLFLNFKMYKNLHKFIYDFRWLSLPKKLRNEEKTDEFEMETDSAIKSPKRIQHELIQLLDTHPRDHDLLKNSPSQAKRLITVATDRMKYLNRNRDDPDLTNDNQLPNTLLDLANYEYDDLIQHSLLLLDRHYTSVSDVFQKALKAHLLKTEVSAEVYNVVEKNLLRLKAFLRAGSNADEEDESSVKILTDFCWLGGEVEGCEPHLINQNIILSFGILPDVLKYVVNHSSGTSAGQESKKIIECLLFLRSLACKNPEVQNRLLEYMDLFLKLARGKLGPHIGSLLQEIFGGGPSISLSVTEDQINKMMHLIFARGKEHSPKTNAPLLNALQELLQVKELNLPLKHNQLIVARNFGLMREDDRYWCKDLISEGMADHRWMLLTAEDDSDYRLINLLMTTDLLATLAKGDSAGADSLCCTIYSENELIKIISSKDIKLYRKRPFLKFLVWVYMSADGEVFEDRSNLYKKNKDLWYHMCEMATILRGTSEIMKDMPHPSYLSVKELIVDPLWKYLHECPNRKHLQSPPAIITREKIDISDVLLYASEGFLPFLQAFYTGFYKKNQEQQLVLEGSATDELYKALFALHPSLVSKRVYFTSEVQVKLYFRVLLVMKQHSTCQLTDELFKLEDSVSSPEAFNQELVTEARENYELTYEGETEFNSRFRQFVINYKAAYEGENTRRAQIIDARNKRSVSDKEPYSEFQDESANKPGLRFLPLGTSFQEHVGIFKIHKVGGGALGSLGDIAARGINVFGWGEKSEDVVRNPKERLLRQLEISLSKKRSGTNSSSEIDSERQTELDIKCLQILRASIYNEIIQINEEDKERNPKKFRKKCELHLHPVQNEIQDLGNAVLRVMPLLSHPNQTIIYEVMAFLEVLFEFGNPHVQEGSKELLNLYENRIFQILQRGLRTATLIYKESQLLTTLVKARINSDKRIIAQVEIVSNGKEPETPLSSLAHRSSSVREDGTVVLTAPRRSIFRRRQTTQVVIAGGDKRIPFLAIYQHSDANAALGEKVLNIVQFSDLSRITMVIKVLGLLCDGQNRQMQNFLREQSKSFSSINVVGEITSVLYEFTEKRQISYDSLPLYIEILQSLIEVCLGNYKNHKVVFNKHITSVINFIFQIDITGIKPPSRFGRRVSTTVITDIADMEDLGNTPENGSSKLNYVDLRVMALKLKVSAIELLEVMMEEISTKSKRLTQQIAEGLDIRGLHSSMADLFLLKSDKDIIQKEHDDNASRALYKAYKIIMHLVDSENGSLESLKPTEKSALRAWQFCEKKSRSIEIVYRDEENEEVVLTKVHFDANINTEINERLKDSVKYKVERTTHSDKLRDYHEWIDAVKKDTLHHDWLRRRRLSPITFMSRARYWFLLLLTLLLNVAVLTLYKVDPNQRSIPTKPFIGINGFQENPALFYTLGGLHILLSLWMVLEYFTVTCTHFVLPEFLYNIRLIPRSFGNYKLTAWLTRVRLLPDIHRTHSSVNLFGATTLYVIIFLASSVLSLALANLGYIGYFYCLCLLYVIVNNDILQRALQSVTKNWKSLVWVALLLLAILFIYSVAAFAFFQQNFVDAEDNNVFCESLDQCFVSVLRFGLIDNFLEIGFLGTDRTEKARQARSRFAFDVTFFIIVTTIGLNIVFGIIVDTFSELRDERYHAEQDMKSNCFICGLPNHEFEKLSNRGFDKHVKNDHNMWDYIYYSIYLDRVDTTDHNATEKYVYEKMKSGNTDYLPLNQALILEGGEDEGEELKREVQELHEVMNQRFKTMNLHFDTRLDAIEKLIKSKK